MEIEASQSLLDMLLEGRYDEFFMNFLIPDYETCTACFRYLIDLQKESENLIDNYLEKDYLRKKDIEEIEYRYQEERQARQKLVSDNSLKDDEVKNLDIQRQKSQELNLNLKKNVQNQKNHIGKLEIEISNLKTKIVEDRLEITNYEGMG